MTEAEVVEDSLSISIAEDELPEGTETTVTVEAGFTDGSVLDVTTDATLTSLDTDVATVANDGTVTAVGEGTVQIEAEYSGETETVGLTVTEAEVIEDGLTVTIAEDELPEGTETTVTVEAEFTDGSTQVVTTDSTLTSLDTGVATVASDGTVTAVGEGSVLIEAAFEGETETVGLTVTEAEVVEGGLSISITDDEIPDGTETTVTVEAEFTDGSVLDVTTDATLTSLDTDVATVANDGTVTAVGEGSVLIEASFEGETETVGLTVTEAEIVEDGLSVSIADNELPEGTETTVTVEAEFTDGSTQDVTTDATLTSLDTGVSTVANDGTVTAVGEGTVQIQADYNGETDSVALTVTEAEVISDGLSVTIVDEEIPEGTETTVTVEAEFTDGSTQDVTTEATLTSLDTGVATVANDGAVTAAALGITQIEATFEGETDTVSLTVTEAVVVDGGLTATLAADELPAGTQTTMTVHAEFTNGSVQDVTDAATLTSLDSSVATVENDGTVLTTHAGTATLEATYAGEAATVQIEVEPAVVESLDASLADDTLVAGEQTQLTVTATYSDGSTADVTQAASLAAGETTVATIANDGLVTANAGGTTTLTATYEGETAGHAVTVLDPAFFEVELLEQPADVTEGEQLTLTAEVSNTGDVEVTQVVELLDFDGSVVDSEPLTLSPGQTATVSLDWDTNLGDAGTGTLTVRTADDAASSQAVVVKEWTSPGTGPDPGDDAAYFAVSVQDISEDVTAGTTVTVDVLVENTGGAHGTQELRLYDFDGALVSTSEPLTLDVGETATVTLTWNTATGDGGEGALTVASDDESASTPLVLITSPDGDGPPGDTGDGQSGDETTPHISGFVVSNPVDQDVRVVVVSSDPLDTIVVNVDGPESGTLTETDFTEQVRGDDFRYVGMYDGSSDGRYVVTLVSAADAAGNDGATDRSVWLTIESADGANSGVAGQNPIVFEDLTVASEGDYDIGVETTALDLDAVVFDPADQRLTFDFAAFSDTGQSFTEATGNVAIGSIDIEQITGAVDDATISFAVNKQYLEAVGTDPDALQLYRHTDGEWQPLSTFIVDETDETYRYEAATDGLDEFAVGVEAPVFVVEGISVSEETVSTDDVVFVDVTVRNVGSASGEYDARLLADGTVVATQAVDVPTESSRTVTFEHSFSEDGTRMLAVDSRHSVEVVVVEDSSPGPIWLLGLLGILLAGAFVFSRRRGGLTIRVDNPRGNDVRVTIDSPDELEEFEVSVGGAESAMLTPSDFTVSVEDDYTYTATYAGSVAGTYVVSVAVGPDSGRTVSDSVVIE